MQCFVHNIIDDHTNPGLGSIGCLGHVNSLVTAQGDVYVISLCFRTNQVS